MKHYYIRYISYYSLTIISMLLFACSLCQGWSWVYSSCPAGKKSETIWQWTRENTPGYTQLIFSWNALRPKKGHFTFWVRARDKKTKKWHSWHKAASWGKNIQASYFSKLTRSTEFSHVRLEIPQYTQADGFSLKIKACDGAQLDTIKAASINIINLKKFITEANDKVIRKLSSIKIKSVPRLSQMALDHPKIDAICSPTSLTMVLNFLLKDNYDPCKVAEGAFDKGLKAYGSWPFNTAHGFELSQGKILFQVVRLWSFKQVHELLKKSIPVIASVRGPLKGSATPYAHGHLLVIIGYDDKTQKVLCHDPAFSHVDQVYMEYELHDFLLAWERSKRLVYKAVWASGEKL